MSTNKEETDDIYSWTRQDVLQFLDRLGLSPLKPAFETNAGKFHVL